MNIQWYPGHMTKAKRMMEDQLKLVDIIIEIIDARIPYSSINPEFVKLTNNKGRLLIINKSDLADKNMNLKWKTYFEEKGFVTLIFDAKCGIGKKELINKINIAASAKKERDKKRGILNRPVRAMVVGIPNVGKSTIINLLAGKSVTKTGNKPGVTKGKQWIRLNKDVELLDTPGVLWPKFDNDLIGDHLAFIGSINDDILIIDELAEEIVKYLTFYQKGSLNKLYNIDENNKPYDIILEIAQNNNIIKKGNELDYTKTCRMIVDDYRSAKIGKFTIEDTDLIN